MYDCYLIAEYYSDSTHHYLFEQPIVTLREEESNLDKDRFLNFIRIPQNHVVKIPLHLISFQKLLTWINNNGIGVWNYSIEWYDMKENVGVWSFEDSNTALLFRLSN